jgi:hypothetical protein
LARLDGIFFPIKEKELKTFTGINLRCYVICYSLGKGIADGLASKVQSLKVATSPAKQVAEKEGHGDGKSQGEDVTGSKPAGVNDKGIDTEHVIPLSQQGSGAACDDRAREEQVLESTVPKPVDDGLPQASDDGNGVRVDQQGGHGEEVGDNGLAPQAPVQSVLHKAVADVARQWEDKIAESERSKGPRKFRRKHCSTSDNLQEGVGTPLNGGLGNASEEARNLRAEFPSMSEGEAVRMAAVCCGDNCVSWR